MRGGCLSAGYLWFLSLFWVILDWFLFQFSLRIGQSNTNFLLGYTVSLLIQKWTAKNYVVADSKIDSQSCITANSKIDSQTMPLSIQKSAAKLRRCRLRRCRLRNRQPKNLSLLIQKLTAQSASLLIKNSIVETTSLSIWKAYKNFSLPIKKSTAKSASLSIKKLAPKIVSLSIQKSTTKLCRCRFRNQQQNFGAAS